MLTELDCKENVKNGEWTPRPEPGRSCQNLQIKKKAEKQMESITRTWIVRPWKYYPPFSKKMPTSLLGNRHICQA